MRVHITRRGIAYGLFCVIAGGALSVAGSAVIFQGPINGSTTNAATPAIFYALPVTITDDGSGIFCISGLGNVGAPTPVAPAGYFNELTLGITNAFPSSVCTYKVSVIASGGATVLQAIVFNVTGAPGTAFTAALGSSCGTALSHTASSPTTVTFTVTAPPASSWTAGQSGTIVGDLQAVPAAQYSSSACT